jgi:hypothetical protein
VTSVTGFAHGGATWAPQTSGVTVALNTVTCPAGACCATGAVIGGRAVMLKLTDGSTWTTQASNSPQALAEAFGSSERPA